MNTAAAPLPGAVSVPDSSYPLSPTAIEHSDEAAYNNNAAREHRHEGEDPDPEMTLDRDAGGGG